MEEDADVQMQAVQEEIDRMPHRRRARFLEALQRQSEDVSRDRERSPRPTRGADKDL